jgi:ribosomal peptide maturation radical SAM protein 1
MGEELIRRFPFVDAVVSGEGDLVFPELAGRLLAGRPVAGLDGVLTRTDGPSGRTAHTPVVRDLDALPFPDFDDFFEQWAPFFEKHRGPPATLLFESARGCWWGERHHCTFCGLNGATMSFRSKSPDRALRELRWLVDRYPARAVSVVDNILDMKYFRTLVPALGRLGLDLELFYEVKANLRKDQLQLLKDAGITTICPGVESLSTSLLRRMRKGVTALQNVQLLKWCRQVGVRPLWNVLWGFPGEDPEEYARMARLLPLLAHLAPPFWFIPIRVDRFSPYFDDPAAFGIAPARPYPAYAYVYPGLDPDAIGNLAYYFAIDPAARRPAMESVGMLGDAIARWRADHPASDLVAVDDGERVTIFDTRPIAGEPVVELSGVDRLLYLACDAIRSEAHLIRSAREEWGIDLTGPALHQRLRPLLDAGFLLEEAGQYLSLAVVAEQYEPGDAALGSLLAALVPGGPADDPLAAPAEGG